MPHRPKHDWAAIRHAYEGGDGTVRQIRARFGVAYSSFSYRALNEGWDLCQPGISLGQKKDAWRLSSRVKLIARQNKIIGRQLDHLALRLQEQEQSEGHQALGSGPIN